MSWGESLDNSLKAKGILTDFPTWSGEASDRAAWRLLIGKISEEQLSDDDDDDDPADTDEGSENSESE